MNMRSLIVAALIAHLALAEFTENDLDRKFVLEIGDRSNCGFQIEFDEESFSQRASDIKIENDKCKGGTLSLSQNPKTDASAAAQFLLNEPRSGNFLGGKLDDDLTCNEFSIGSDTEFIFFEPEDDFDVKWSDFFQGESLIEDISGDDDFEFDDGTSYLIINSDCLYIPESSLSDSVCFPAAATAELKSGAHVRMDQLSTGDEVLVAQGVYSQIVAWTHRDASARHGPYVKIETREGHAFVATDSHYVYADGEIRRAGLVEVGMKMWTGKGEDAVVMRVARVKGSGLYNPQTAHGDIVVNGLVSSTYTAAVKPEVAHALLTPVRAVVKAAMCSSMFLKGNVLSMMG